MTEKDELAELKREVAELKARANPEPSPDPRSFPRHDYTAGFSMPPSVVREMAAVGGSFVRDVVERDARAPSGPVSMIPEKTSGGSRAREPLPSPTPGWRDPTPLGPSPHQRYVDEQLDEADRRDRAVLSANLSSPEFEELKRQHAVFEETVAALKKSGGL
jgi:hypothetical protein